MIYITRTQKAIAAVAILILIIISGTIYVTQEKATEISLGNEIAHTVTAAPTPAEVEKEVKVEDISVHICGSVKNPGVIKVIEGTRLDEAVRMAGGATAKADLNAVNLAYKLVDEDKIYIPEKGEKLQGAGKAVTGVNTIKNATIDKSGKVNINSASASELDTLNGVGPVTAKAIIKYRTEKGVFNSIEDIKKVVGIGDSKFSKLKDDITVD